MRVAIYLRRSTSNKQEHSIAVQRAEAHALVARNGWEIVAEYEDSESASKMAFAHRPQGARLLEDAEHGLFDAIITYKRDRLFRQTIDSAITLALFREWGIRLCFTHEADMDDSELAPVMEIIRASISALETQKTSDRVVATSRLRAQNGQHLPPIPPFGYQWHADKTAGYVVVPREEALVAGIFDSYTNRGWGTQQIADTLNQRDTLGRAGRPWTSSRVAKVIHNPIYKGHQYVTIKGETFDMRSQLIPPIVSEGQWARAQELMQEKDRAPRRLATTRLATGIIACGRCGTPLEAHVSTRPHTRSDGSEVTYDYSYYYCPAAADGSGRCTTPRVRCAVLDALILEEVQRVAIPQQINELVARSLEVLEKFAADAERTQQALTQTIAEHQRSIDLYKRYAETLDRAWERYDRMIGRLEQRIDQDRAELARLQQAVATRTLDVDRSKRLVAELSKAGFLSLEIPAQKVILNECVRGVWNDTNQRVVLHLVTSVDLGARGDTPATA